MAGDLRRWRVHTLTDYLVFSFQANVFIAGDKQDVVRGFEIQGKVHGLEKNNFSILVRGSGLKLCPKRWSLAVSWAVVISPWSTMAQIPS